MNPDDRESRMVEIMVLTQKLNEWTLKMQLNRIQQTSKRMKNEPTR